MKTYFVQQKIQLLVNQYSIFEATESGKAGAMVGFAQQKRLAFKERFTVYTDDSKQAVAFVIQARQVLDFGARYDIIDAYGRWLGTVGKNFKSSLLRSTWFVYQPGNEDAPALIARERSQSLAIIRRVWESLPIVGDIPFFIKYHFDFIDPIGQQVASYEKITTIRDHYRLTIQDNAPQVEPRVLISLGILLDTLQSR